MPSLILLQPTQHHDYGDRTHCKVDFDVTVLTESLNVGKWQVSRERSINAALYIETALTCLACVHVITWNDGLRRLLK